MILKCVNVTKQFGQLKAVDDLSFEVQDGEIFGIAGPNGSGKTTLFNLITGVYPHSGSIHFQGKNISKMKAYTICHHGIARTFQIPQLFLSMSVYENVMVANHFGNLGQHGNEKTFIEKILHFVGLEKNKFAYASKLNLLNKKRVMIAAALATSPKLLLLDEPIAGLSPGETKEAISLFKKINDELGLTIIIIEHFMKVLLELSERLMVLENGQKICIDSPINVSNNKKVIECYLGDSHARS